MNIGAVVGLRGFYRASDKGVIPSVELKHQQSEQVT